MERKLPFPLCKRHKYFKKHDWEKSGLKWETQEEFDYIYDRYRYATNCELCGKEFKSTRNRRMDHNHETGKFRNVVCGACNSHKKDVKIKCDNTTGEKFISKCNSKKRTQGFYYQIAIRRNGKNEIMKECMTLEKAIKIRDDFIKEHPEIFS